MDYKNIIITFLIVLFLTPTYIYANNPSSFKSEDTVKKDTLYTEFLKIL